MKHWLLWSLLSFPFLADAGGFQINTQGQKATGMGGSVTGRAMDASVSFFNPGGLSALDSNGFNAGLSFLMPKTSFLGVSGGEENMASQLYTPFYVYGAYKLKEKWSIGLSVNTPFGLGTKWEDNWTGRYVSQEAKLRSLYIQPTLAYKINDKLSIGAGPVFGMGNASLRRGLPVTNADGSEGEVTLEGKGNGIGFNAGVFFQSGNSSAGISYRSAVEMSIDGGDATFENIPTSLINNGTFPQSASFNTSLTLPSVISVGFGHKFTDKLEANLDVNYTGWEVYDSLVFEFPDEPSLNSTQVHNYKNCIAVRVGAQYQYNTRLQLRGGLAFDQSPVEDGYVNPDLPDGDKIVVTGGLSWMLKNGWTIEATLLLEEVKERNEENNVENQFNGTYKSFIYAAGVGIQYRF